jgi:predicted transcriptional regulator
VAKQKKRKMAMRVKKFEGVAYSQTRKLIYEWLEKKPGITIVKTREKRSMKKRTVWIFYRG